MMHRRNVYAFTRLLMKRGTFWTYTDQVKFLVYEMSDAVTCQHEQIFYWGMGEEPC